MLLGSIKCSLNIHVFGRAIEYSIPFTNSMILLLLSQENNVPSWFSASFASILQACSCLAIPVSVSQRYISYFNRLEKWWISELDATNPNPYRYWMRNTPIYPFPYITWVKINFPPLLDFFIPIVSHSDRPRYHESFLSIEENNLQWRTKLILVKDWVPLSLRRTKLFWKKK